MPETTTDGGARPAPGWARTEPMAGASRAGGRGPARSGRSGGRRAASMAWESASCVRVTIVATHAAIAPIRPITGSASGYSGPSSAPDAEGVPVDDRVLDVLLDHEARCDHGRKSQPGDEEPLRQGSAGMARRPKVGGASSKVPHPEPDRDRRRRPRPRSGRGLPNPNTRGPQSAGCWRAPLPDRSG